ncbi:MAG: hypothetical protein IJT18_06745, partial [Oscillospiraceae bacterium]|nr:hypothetical protein [Oscillospiraceae bacterium]
AVIAADGEVLEAGSVTVMGDNGEVSCASNDFTEADVGSYAICLGLGKTSWKNVISLYSAKRATIVSGKLESEDKTVKVSGKTYKVVNSTMVLAQPTSPYPADYIANGGSMGDTVNLVLDDAGVCYAIYQ